MASRVTKYTAIVRPRGKLFEARFVDFENCVAYGLSPKEAEGKAQFALAIWGKYLNRFGGTMPRPSLSKSDPCDASSYTVSIPLRYKLPAG